MKNLLTVLCFFVLTGLYAQDSQPASVEYLVVRVQYGKTIAGYKYEVFVDIGTSGAHSLSGSVTNSGTSVIITDESGKHEFQSDMDLVNYFGKHGWQVIESGELDLLDQRYTTYLMEKRN